MAYNRRNVADGSTVMNADLYNNLQDGIDENANMCDQALAIIKGRNQALAYNSYSEMITTLNSMGADELKRGQNIYIGTVGVPDLWVYGVETSSVTYSYVDDSTFVQNLDTNTTVQIGYYKLAQLETQKVDLVEINTGISDLQSDVGTLNTNIGTLQNKIENINAYPLGLTKYENEIIVEDSLPYEFSNGGAVVYNDEIYLLGGYNYESSFYKYDGSTWVSVGSMPYKFTYSPAIVYNNEIHILGSGNNSACYKYHYKWDGSSWSSVSTLPYNFSCGSAVIYNNEIHILGSNQSGYQTNHYKWDGSSWSRVSTLPYNFYNASAFVYNNQIHIIGGDNPNYYNYHYKWDGSSWTKLTNLANTSNYSSVVLYNNKIYLFDLQSTYRMYDGISWKTVFNDKYNSFNDGSAVVLNGFIHLLGGNRNASNLRKRHYKLRDMTLMQGYAKENTNIYLPKNSKPITSNLQAITDGYKVTSDGEVKIEVYE